MPNAKTLRKSRQSGIGDKQKKFAASASKGFTLLEVMFVTLIIGIIAATVVVAIGKSAKERSRIAASLKFSDSVRAQLSGYPISWWKFEETSGVAAIDSWGGNNGTINGSVTRVKGVTGKALDFNGGHIDIPENPSLTITNKMTVEFWVKPDNTGAGMTFISKHSGSSGNSWMIHKHGSNGGNTVMIIVWGISNGRNVRTIDGLTNEKWTHVVGVYDGVAGTLEIYINGVKKAYQNTGVPVSLKATADGIRIGKNLNGGRPFYGDMDEVRIYGEALTAQKIQQRYVENAPKYGLVLK